MTIISGLLVKQPSKNCNCGISLENRNFHVTRKQELCKYTQHAVFWAHLYDTMYLAIVFEEVFFLISFESTLNGCFLTSNGWNFKL